MASLEKLQNEILLKEEAFLREEKAKLMEQLNKLKVKPLLNFQIFSLPCSRIEAFCHLLKCFRWKKWPL